MKKVLTILLVLAMVFSMAGVVSADEGFDGDNGGSTEVEYSADEKYLVRVPVTVTIGENYEGSGTVDVLWSRVEEDSALKINVVSYNGYNLVYSTSKIPYTLTIGSTGTLIDAENDVVLKSPAGTGATSETLLFETTMEDVNKATISARHTDILTFNLEAVVVKVVLNDLGTNHDVRLSEIQNAFNNDDIEDVEVPAIAGGYNYAGVVVNGATYNDDGSVKTPAESLDGNGKTLDVTGADSTWSCAVYTTGGTIKDLTIVGGMRGIFTGGTSSDIYIENVIIDGTVYTFNSDDGNKNYGVYITDSTLNGWTSFSNVHKEVVFRYCNFGEGSGYAFCRPYNACEFIDCNFESGFTIGLVEQEAIFKNCYLDGVLITSENINTLVTSNAHLAVVENS